MSLAMFLNQWRENETTKKKVVRVLENIQQEVLLNDSLVRKSLDYRMDLLKKMETGNHRIFSIPMADLDIDARNDQLLAKEIATGLLFYSHFYYDRVEVRSLEEKRVLILGDMVFDLISRNDTLLVLGVGGIQLRAADLSLNSLQIAQATGVLVELDLALVEALSKLNTLIQNYQNTSSDAIKFIYNGKQSAIVSAMQDMTYFEGQIIKANESVLKLLEG